MKKHLIAAAVAATLAVPAMAQVSISGRIDTAVASKKAQGTAGNATVTSLTDNLLTSNQLVLSGSEDLGGGIKASFTISSPVESDTNSSSFNFGGRGMIVGISGGFGAINLGRSTGSMGLSIMASGFNGNLGNLGVEDGRPNDSISYHTPAISGFSGRVLYGIGDEDAADTSKGKQVEISGEYKAGALLIRASHATHTEATGSNDKTETGLQVNYDLGMAAINVRYMEMDVDGGNTSDTTRMGVGVSVPLGAGLSVFADHWSYDANVSTADYSVTSAGVVKALSKRTNVYGVYATANTKSGATGNSGNQISAGLAGKDPSVLAIGVRHSF